MKHLWHPANRRIRMLALQLRKTHSTFLNFGSQEKQVRSVSVKAREGCQNRKLFERSHLSYSGLRSTLSWQVLTGESGLPMHHFWLFICFGILIAHHIFWNHKCWGHSASASWSNWSWVTTWSFEQRHRSLANHLQKSGTAQPFTLLLCLGVLRWNNSRA